jgi:hypothetical protein
MPFSIQIKTNFTFDDVIKEIVQAHEAAVIAAAGVATTPLKAAVPFDTGRMASQVGIRFFKQKNKLMGASIKVIGDRHFVAHILEYGTKDGRIKARHTFERAQAAIESQILSVYDDTFTRKLAEFNGK